MKYEPMNDRILVKRIEADEVSEGGIIIPAQAVEKPLKGEVVAVGKGRYEQGFREIDNYQESTIGRVAPDCKVGDIVLFGKYAGTEIKIDGVDHLVLREDDILLKESVDE